MRLRSASKKGKNNMKENLNNEEDKQIVSVINPTMKRQKDKEDSPLTEIYSSNEEIRTNNIKKEGKKVKEVKAKKIKVYKVPLPNKHKPPSDWEDTFLKIKDYRATHLAPVDSMGCERVEGSDLKPEEYRFHVLVSLMLSSQTRDEDTYIALKKLKEACGANLTPQLLLNLDTEVLHQCIRGVGFHNQKLKFIQKAAKICIEKFKGDIPSTLDELMALPGVGPKMAFLAMQCAWDANVGIGVDIHVHRITNRLGWIKTSTPEQTRVQLESFVPDTYWRSINFVLVGFGQTICTGNKPKCYMCPVKEKCPSFDKKAAPPKGKNGQVIDYNQIKMRTSQFPAYKDGSAKIKLETEIATGDIKVKDETNELKIEDRNDEGLVKDKTNSKYFISNGKSKLEPISSDNEL